MPATPTPPITLSIDIGGTGLKASLLDAGGAMIADRVRVATTYPCPPDDLVERLVELAAGLEPANALEAAATLEPAGVPAWDRVSVGFPGVVRHGRIVSAPHFVTTCGPGSPIDPVLRDAWQGFDLAAALAEALHAPARVINDADLQGLDVIAGTGVELVVTFGAGVGTAVFVDGRLGPRLELSHHPLHDGRTYNEDLGDAAWRSVGTDVWNQRAVRCLGVLAALLFPDRIYVGGGNARHLPDELPDPLTAIVTRIDPNAGILGGLQLWSQLDAD